MGAETRIEWADHSFNPWTGCQAVSPACDHCYAEAQAKRNTATFGGWGPHAARKRTSESYWRQPLKWNSEARKAGTRPRVFCASLADIMDKAAPLVWFIDALDLMRVTQHLIWLLLTKRPQMIRRRLEEALAHLSKGIDRGDLIEWIALWLDGHAPENVWLGTTVENQAEADRRIPHLLAVPAGKRFLSCEPLLGPIDLSVAWHGESALDAECWGECKWCESGHPALHNCQRGRQSEDVFMRGIGIDWIIAGGESGPTARPSHPDWFRSLRDQCQAAGVPFFFKQWGEWRPICQGEADWYDGLYRSRVAARQGEDQAAKDEVYGRICTVPQLCLRVDGQHAGITEPMAWRQGSGAILSFRVGKKAAGAALDGREWREVPA